MSSNEHDRPSTAPQQQFEDAGSRRARDSGADAAAAAADFSRRPRSSTSSGGINSRPISRGSSFRATISSRAKRRAKSPNSRAGSASSVRRLSTPAAAGVYAATAGAESALAEPALYDIDRGDEHVGDDRYEMIPEDIDGLVAFDDGLGPVGLRPFRRTRDADDDDDIEDETVDLEVKFFKNCKRRLQSEYERIKSLELAAFVKRKTATHLARTKHMPVLVNRTETLGNGHVHRKLRFGPDGEIRNSMTDILTHPSRKDVDVDDEDDEDTYGKRAFLKRCYAFDFFSFPVRLILERLDSKHIELAHLSIGDKGCAALAAGLRRNRHARRLDLLDNAITPEGAEPLMSALRDNNSIKTLDLSDNRLGLKSCIKDLSPMLSQMLSKNSTLTSLVLRGNRLGDRHAKALADALAENYSMSNLDLSHNELTQKAGEYIEKLLVSNVSIRVLNLEWNALLDRGAIHVLNGLKNNNAVTSVNLAWNGLCDAAAVEIGSVLHVNTAIEHMDVSHNRIGKDGARGIARGLKDNTAIRRFNLSHNHMLGREGIRFITAVLKDVRRLVEIDLRSTRAMAPNERQLRRLAEAVGASQMLDKALLADDQLDAFNVPPSAAAVAALEAGYRAEIEAQRKAEEERIAAEKAARAAAKKKR